MNKETLYEWIESYSEYLLVKASQYISNKDDAMDVVQDVFLSLCETNNKFRGEASPKTLLTSILKNKVADYYRKHYRNPQKISLEHFFDDNGGWKDPKVAESWDNNDTNILDNPDFCSTLDNCMGKLPRNWNTAITLYYLQKKNTKEVCEHLQISTNNLWKILQRCRLQLRECIEINWNNR